MMDKNLSINWFKQSEYDFKSAKSNAEIGNHALACFLAYESSVKIVSGYLYNKGAEFIWGSSLSDLCEDAMVFDPSFDLVKSVAMLLDKYCLPTRFPSNLPGSPPYEIYDNNDSSRAIEIADEVIKTIKSRL